MAGAPLITVVIPAYRCGATLAAAIRSALEGDHPNVEIAVAINDAEDYARTLAFSAAERARIQWTRTARPGGPASESRNAAQALAQGDLIAFLDADDVYAPDRLSRLAPLALEAGAACGPCRPIAPERRDAPGALAPLESGAPRPMALEEIIASRRSFSPVLTRAQLRPWRPVRFAEDMLYNAELIERAPGYLYDPEAVYGYIQTPGSSSRGPGSLERAITGYGDMLGILFQLELSETARRRLFQQLAADLAHFGEARFAGTAESWKEARDK